MDIYYETDRIIACGKPAGILSEAGGMPDLLCKEYGYRNIYCVHRLDKDVSGVMLFAKDGKAAAQLSEAFSKNEIKKEYLAVCEGKPEPSAGLLRDLLFHDKTKNKTYVTDKMRGGVKQAELAYEVLESVELEAGVLSMLSITLHTGRTHQIRVQFASRRMPLVGDRKYGSHIKDTGIALLSHKISFNDAFTGKHVTVTAPIPDKFPWNTFNAVDVIINNR